MMLESLTWSLECRSGVLAAILRNRGETSHNERDVVVRFMNKKGHIIGSNQASDANILQHSKSEKVL